jgi:hypothetical protein
MGELVQDSIMGGTDNNHGMSDQIISIIQMHPAWVKVIMEQITPATTLMLQAITKVIMDAQTNSMTTPTTTMVPRDLEAVAVEVEEVIVVEAAMDKTSTSLSLINSHNSLAYNPMEPQVIPVIFRQDQRPTMQTALSMNSVERFAKKRTLKKVHLQRLLMRMQSKSLVPPLQKMGRQPK